MTSDEGMRLVVAQVAEILLMAECLAIRFSTTGAVTRWPDHPGFAARDAMALQGWARR